MFVWTGPARFVVDTACALGTLMGAVLLGVLLSRILAAVIADTSGRRGVHVLAAGLRAVTTVVLSRVPPAAGREAAIGYVARMSAVP